MQNGIDRYLMATELPTAARLDGLALITVGYGLLVAAGLPGRLPADAGPGTGRPDHHARHAPGPLRPYPADLDLHFFNRNAMGRLVTRLTNDIQNMYEMFTSVMVTLFNELS